MKAKLLTIVCFLLLSTTGSLLAQPQYVNFTAPSGTINVSAVYTNNVYRIWDINTGQNKPIKINYDIDIEYEYDFIWIYFIDENGDEDGEIELTGKQRGSLTTMFPNGKARIVFWTNSSINFSGGSFNPSTISYSVDESSISASNLFVEENATVNGRVGIGNYNGGTAKLAVYNYNYANQSNNIPYGIYSYSFNNRNSASSAGIYSYAYASGLNSRAHGVFANAHGGNSTSSVYGIYSTVSGTTGAKRWAGYFAGGDVEINRGNLIIGSDALRQFIFHTSWATGDPAWLTIAPRKNATEWDWSKQLLFKDDGSFSVNGNVGIGTTNPQYKLHVNGKVYIDRNETINAWDYAYLHWRGHSLVMGSPVGHYAHNSIDLKPGGANQGSLFSQIRMYTATASNQQTLNIQMNSNGHTYFNNPGNFGIGTTTPHYKLDVNGTIRAREIKINLNSGADFVFEDDYNLRPIEEVYSFIKENKHLPEIPSAAEMVSNGLEMGEFQIKLLQKIEELTLYIIEQQKEINLLKEIIQK